MKQRNVFRMKRSGNASIEKSPLYLYKERKDHWESISFAKEFLTRLSGFFFALAVTKLNPICIHIEKFGSRSMLDWFLLAGHFSA